MVKLATESHETTADVVIASRQSSCMQTLYIDRVVRENGNFCCHERPVCS